MELHAQFFTGKLMLAAILLLSVIAQVEAQMIDTTPPEILEVSVSPSIIDTTKSAQIVTLIVRAADVGSGIRYISVAFKTETESYYTEFNLSEANLISGDRNNGVYRMEKVFPRYSRAAIINIGQIHVQDSTNYVNLSGAALTQRGLAAQVRVISNDEDLLPPEISDFSFTPSVIDMSEGTQTVTITFRATDAKGGVRSVTVNFNRPGDDYSYVFELNNQHRISGDDKNGVYRRDVTFRRDTPPGIYKASVFAADTLNNFKSIHSQDLAAHGFTSQLQISGSQIALVSISGRLLTADGRAVSRAIVTLTGPTGRVRYATTNSFGYYRFASVSILETYNLAVNHKRHGFGPRPLYVDRTITNLNFTMSEKID